MRNVEKRHSCRCRIKHAQLKRFGVSRFWVAATHIRMNSRKPDLLHILLSVIRRAKEILAEERPALIYGHCMPDNLEVGIVRRRRKREVNSVINPAHRANRIPYAHEVRFTLAREGLFEISRDREVDLFALNYSDCIGDQAFVAFGEEADDVKHSAKGAGSVGPAAEPKDVEMVVRLKCPYQELVGIRHVIGNAVTEREADHTRPPLANSRERVPRTHRADARVVIRDLSPIADQHLVELHHVRVLFAELIAGTVAADHDVSWH